MYIIYPVEREVNDNEMVQRGMDAYYNGEIQEIPEDADHAALLLEDAGIITLGRIG